MPTWAELQRFARSKYQLAADEPEFFSIVFTYEAAKRLQTITVRRFEAYEKEWIELYSPVCRETEINAGVLLARNMQLHVGALGTTDGMVFLRYTMQLPELDVHEFTTPLHALASAADMLEGLYTAKDVY